METRVFYLIESCQFWIGLLAIKTVLIFQKLEANAIPPEPKWVDALRFQKRKIKGNHYRLWTTKEARWIGA